VTADPVTRFADAVGADGPVVAVGGRTQWSVGGPVGVDAREVHPPVGVVAVEPADLTVRVRAGTLVSELDDALDAVGQTVALPPWPGATVGGVVSVGASGLRHLGWGPVRDTVLAMTYVDDGGRVVKAGGPVVKNVSGFDLCRLLVGSLGTLGLIAEVVLKTRPLPATSRWFAGETDPFVLRHRLHAPNALLWDGITTWVLLEGHPTDVAAEAALAALPEVEGPPELPPWRRSMRPSTLRTLAPGDGGGFVAQVGVGVVHQHEPPPPRRVEPALLDLHRRVKQTFDPHGRLGPGRDPLHPLAA
jgi:glycolate oxidase FAD binding subunit